MNPTKLPSKRKALKELFRSNKRVHTSSDASSSSTSVPNAQTAAGSAELVPPFEGSEVGSNQHNGSSHSDANVNDAVTGSSALVPITTAAPMKPGGMPSISQTRDVVTAAEMAWSAFKATLPVLEKVSVVFPPLQSAVGGLIKVIAQFDVSCETHGREGLMNTDHTSNPDL